MDEEFKIKLNADTREASGSIKRLQRQIEKLEDIAEQGETKRNGFLTKKQVNLSKKMLEEIEKNYEKHYRNLERVEAEYYKKKESLQRRVDNYDNKYKVATGGNEWGDKAHDVVQNFYKGKLGESKKELADFSELEKQIGGLKQALTSIEDRREYALRQEQRIGNLYQETSPQLANGALGMMAGAGMVTNMGSYFGYARSGVMNLRQQEMYASGITQKLGLYQGETHDSKLRDNTADVGLENHFGVTDTLYLQGKMIRGNYTNDQSLEEDTRSAQEFGRAYAVNPLELATSATMMQRMGSLEEGDMRRFANMIGGVISKTGMRGREEEMVRATNSLAHSVSTGLVELSEKQRVALAGFQTSLGMELPSMKGQRGAGMLANMDQAIKHGDSAFDLMMGKGTEFVGLEGMWQMQLEKAKGLTPENVQRILKNTRRLTGGNEDHMKLALTEKLGMSADEVENIFSSGLASQWEKGDLPTEQELIDAGALDTADQIFHREDSATDEIARQKAIAEDYKATHNKAVEEATKTLGGWWADLPEPIKHMLLPATAAGGSFGGSLVIKSLLDNSKKLTGRTIGKQKPGMPLPNLGPKGTGGAWKSILGGANKILGPVGTLAAAETATQAGDSLGEWFFGYEEGDRKRKRGLFNNPFSSPYTDESYTESKDWVGKRLWDSLMSDNEDEQNISVNTDSSVQTENMRVNVLNVQDRSLQDLIKTVYNKDDETKYSSRSEVLNIPKNRSIDHHVTITIGGKVEGMSKENESEIKDSIKDYFRNNTLFNTPHGYNLSRETVRN